MNDSVCTGGPGWAWQAGSWNSTLVRSLYAEGKRSRDHVGAQSIMHHRCQSSSPT